jgi:hypothetical protein
MTKHVYDLGPLFDPTRYTTGVAECDKENLEEDVRILFSSLYVVSEVRNGIVNV